MGKKLLQEAVKFCKLTSKFQEEPGKYWSDLWFSTVGLRAKNEREQPGEDRLRYAAGALTSSCSVRIIEVKKKRSVKQICNQALNAE